MNRIRRIHLLIVAVVLFVGIAIAFLMVLVKPRKNNITTLDGNIAKQQAVANRLSQAQAALTAAQTTRAAAESRWQQIMKTKMSHISLGDPYRAIFAIYHETPTYAPQLMAAFNKDKGIRLNSSLSFAPYGFTPPPTNLKGREFPQSFQFFAKSFPDLLSWLRNTESLPRVVALGGTISLTQAEQGINVAIPGTVSIYFAEITSASQTQTTQPTAVRPGAVPAAATKGTTAAPQPNRPGAGPGSGGRFGPGAGAPSGRR